MTNNIIQHNLTHIQQQITTYCQNVNRAENSVKLLAVSKTKPIQDILSAYDCGQTAFGENYVQEGIEKIQYCQQHNIQLEWHFIGPLQSNKTKLVAQYFDWMQTLSRAKIADRLNEQRPAHLAPLNVLIQINISNEESKSGISPKDLIPLAKHIEKLPHLRLRGIMAIPEHTDDSAKQIKLFSQMQELFKQLQTLFPQQPIDTLSMGMSADMENAIKCGSTMVRIGTAIFGKRHYN